MKKSPRQRRKQKNKESILDAATRELYEKGLGNISVREIAKKADYSPAALYKYFDSKEALIQAVKARENLKLIEKLNEVDLGLPPSQRLVELCIRYIKYNIKNPVFVTLVNNLVSERRSIQEPIPQSSPYTIFLEAVKEWANFEKVQLDNSYGTEEITYSLWAMIHGMATLRLNQLKNLEADFEQTNRRSIELFLKGIKS